MSEVNGPKISVNQMSFNNISKQNPVDETPDSTESNVQISDFSDAKAEALGRSMLFKGSDDINHDLKALLDNPQIAENSDKIFEVAYQTALANGLANPYEEAASASTTSF